MEGLYTTVKIPRKYRRSIDLVRAEITREGKINDELLEHLQGDTCPFCGTKLHEVKELRIKYAKLAECPKCGFSKPIITAESSIKMEDILTAFGAGLIVGLGIFLIAKSLRRV